MEHTDIHAGIHQKEEAEKLHDSTAKPDVAPLATPLWRRIFEICLGIFFAAILVELLLQVTDRNSYNQFFNDERTGLLIYTPHTSFQTTAECYDNKVSINNAGFYAQDIEQDKKPNTLRIAIVGSSFVESTSIPLSQHFAMLLSQKLNTHATNGISYEVIPFGFAGNGVYLDMLYYEKYVTAYHPDLVIGLVTDYELDKDGGNSVHPPQFDAEGRVILDLPKTQNNPLSILAKNVLRKSKLIMGLYGRLIILRSNMRPKTDPNAIATSSTADASASATERVWKTQEALLSQFQELAHANDSRFFLVSWSRALQDLPVPFTTRINRIADLHTIPHLDLDPIIAKQYAEKNQSPLWSCDGHWNAVGHAWTADAIYDALLAHPELIQTR